MAVEKELPPPPASCPQKCGLMLKKYWKNFLIIIIPLAALPLPILGKTRAMRAAYVTVVMALFWVLELLPLPITSMFPIVLFPVLGILDSDKTCAAYMKETNMMFMGGLMIAAGVQYSKLPKRIALKVVRSIGFSHMKLTLGLGIVTMVLSMWISNAAATATMVPIIEAVLEVFEQNNMIRINHPKPPDAGPEEPASPTDVTICYYLTVAFSATIGGIATLVGTAPNSIFKGIYESEFKGTSVNFLYYMLYSSIPMVFMEACTLLWLNVIFLAMFRPNSKRGKELNISAAAGEEAAKYLSLKYKELGPFNFHEGAAGILFAIAVVMFVFKAPGFMPGWASLTYNMKPKESVTCMLIVILMIAIPNKLFFLQFFKKRSYEELSKIKNSSGLVTWAILKDKVPWGLMFLLGGGFALAEGSKATGLSMMIGQSLTAFESIGDKLLLLAVIIMVSSMTELTSNAAIANLVLPVLANLAVLTGIPPTYLMLPACHACSFCFLLPVGTPCNAIVLGVANIPTKKMALGGIGPKIATTIIGWLTMILLGDIIPVVSIESAPKPRSYAFKSIRRGAITRNAPALNLFCPLQWNNDFSCYTHAEYDCEFDIYQCVLNDTVAILA